MPFFLHSWEHTLLREKLQVSSAMWVGAAGSRGTLDENGMWASIQAS
jgi:hypothetical protein